MDIGNKIYNDIDIKDNKILRIFKVSDINNNLMWHRDNEDRYIEVLNSNGWLFQFDNEYPVCISSIKYIPKGVWHRVIKGYDDLIIKIIKDL